MQILEKMTPCQVSIGAVQETKPGIAVKGMENNGGVGLRCVSNCEDTAFDIEEQKPKDLEVVGNMEEVDIVGGCTDGNGFSRLDQQGDETDDGTEYSSSFGNTCSGDEDGNDSEVDSIYGDSSLFEGFDSMFRMGKKKVTAHWRRYISPLTWRSKWVELRMKEMKSQLLKYDRELASFSQRQKLELGQCPSEDCGVRSLPFFGRSHKKEVMKRRKRKKTEDLVDVSSYMSHHNLFSYYENKKSDADGASVDDDPGVQVVAADINSNDDFDINYACPSLEFRDENSLEHILWKIETVQSRVQKLKVQTEKLLTENAGKFSSVESLTELVQSDVPTTPPRSPALSSGNVEKMPIGALYTPPQHISDHPESAVSSYGEAAPHPDIIECSIAPLSEEVRLDQSYFADSYQNTVNDVVVHDQVVKEEPHDSERVCDARVVKPQEMVKVKEEKVMDVPRTVQALKSEPNLEAKTTQESLLPRSSLPSEFQGPSTKRKRGERKASSGTWNADKMVTQILS